MNTRKATVGRPRTITPERLADAGMAMGLPNVTMLGMAAALKVSPTALYRHFSRLEDLKASIAQETFLRWPLPPVKHCGGQTLETYLLQLAACMWDLVEHHAGLSSYLLRPDMMTAAMRDKIYAHHESVADTFGLPLAQVQWLLSTVTYHCVAVADTLLPLPARLPHTQGGAHWLRAAGIPADAWAQHLRQRYDQGARAMVVGALAVVGEMDLT